MDLSESFFKLLNGSYWNFKFLIVEKKIKNFFFEIGPVVFATGTQTCVTEQKEQGKIFLANIWAGRFLLRY
jgi:hypothetical protein